MAPSRRASSVISGSRAAPSEKKSPLQKNTKTFQPRMDADERGYERSATFRSLQLPKSSRHPIHLTRGCNRTVKRRERRAPPPPRPRVFSLSNHRCGRARQSPREKVRLPGAFCPSSRKHISLRFHLIVFVFVSRRGRRSLDTNRLLIVVRFHAIDVIRRDVERNIDIRAPSRNRGRCACRIRTVHPNTEEPIVVEHRIANRRANRVRICGPRCRYRVVFWIVGVDRV